MSLPGELGTSTVATTEASPYRPRAANYPHAQHLLLNGHSLHCHPGFGWNTSASIAASRKSRTFVARSRVILYRRHPE